MKARVKIKNKKRVDLPVSGEGGMLPNFNINNSAALHDLMEEKFLTKVAKKSKSK